MNNLSAVERARVLLEKRRKLKQQTTAEQFGGQGQQDGKGAELDQEVKSPPSLLSSEEDGPKVNTKEVEQKIQVEKKEEKELPIQLESVVQGNKSGVIPGGFEGVAKEEEEGVKAEEEANEAIESEGESSRYQLSKRPESSL